MTTTEINKFLTMLMGDHWHEGVPLPSGGISRYKCACMEHQSIDPLDRLNNDYLDDPLPVIRWMEKEMSLEWNNYFTEMSNKARGSVGVDGVKRWFNFILDLRNLVNYLWEHQEWGERECGNCYKGMRILEITTKCEYCHGTGKIIHPALQYLKSIKGVKE